MIRKAGGRALIGLVGVQSNQFPRAVDLARPFIAAGLPVWHRRLPCVRLHRHAARIASRHPRGAGARRFVSPHFRSNRAIVGRECRQGLATSNGSMFARRQTSLTMLPFRATGYSLPGFMSAHSIVMPPRPL